MSDGIDHPARWLRIGEAPSYLGVSRRWFDENVRPHVLVIQLSKQAKVVVREELDAWPSTSRIDIATGRPATRKEVTAHGPNENERYYRRYPR